MPNKRKACIEFIKHILNPTEQYCPSKNPEKAARLDFRSFRLARFAQGSENHISSRELRLYEEYESERENEIGKIEI